MTTSEVEQSQLPSSGKLSESSLLQGQYKGAVMIHESLGRNKSPFTTVADTSSSETDMSLHWTAEIERIFKPRCTSYEFLLMLGITKSTRPFPRKKDLSAVMAVCVEAGIVIRSQAEQRAVHGYLTVLIIDGTDLRMSPKATGPSSLRKLYIEYFVTGMTLVASTGGCHCRSPPKCIRSLWS